MKLKALVLLLGLVTIAPAAIIERDIEYTFSLFGGAVLETNWNSTYAVPKFNLAGTLKSVTFTLTGSANGVVMYENTSTTKSSTVNTDMSAEITLRNPTDLSIIVIASPLMQFHDSLTAYDGNTDFGGTSGVNHTVTDLINDTKSATYGSTSSYLAGFIGSGSIYLPVTATDKMTVSKAGGVLTYGEDQYTNAGSSLTIKYTYEISTPEPGVFALVGSALIGLGLFFKRRPRRG